MVNETLESFKARSGLFSFLQILLHHLHVSKVLQSSTHVRIKLSVVLQCISQEMSLKLLVTGLTFSFGI